MTDDTGPREDPANDPAEQQRGWNPTDRLRAELRRIERLLVDPGVQAMQSAHERVLQPAWARVTQGEPRWPASVAILAAIAMQLALPRGIAFRPHWLLPTLQGFMLIGIVAANPRRINRDSTELRGATILLIAVSSLANAWSAGRLIVHLVQGTFKPGPAQLLFTGAEIWFTNVIVFALWYWECDRGGPARRALALRRYPDFLFAQMQLPDLAPPDWEPGFFDYLYLSFTNATAFSPTDVLPLSRWAKMAMMVQSGVALSTVALVVARAVNILK